VIPHYETPREKRDSVNCRLRAARLQGCLFMQMMHIASTVPVQTACRVQPVSVPVGMAGVPSMYGLIVAVTQRHQLCVHRRRSAATQAHRATDARILSRQRAYCARWRGVKGPAQHLAQRTAAARHAAAAACALRNTALHWWLCRTRVVVGPPRHTLWRIAGASLVHRFHVAGMTLCWRGCPRRARLEPQCGACWG
jgi:hypothetical protein